MDLSNENFSEIETRLVTTGLYGKDVVTISSVRRLVYYTTRVPTHECVSHVPGQRSAHVLAGSAEHERRQRRRAVTLETKQLHHLPAMSGVTADSIPDIHPHHSQQSARRTQADQKHIIDGQITIPIGVSD